MTDSSFALTGSMPAPGDIEWQTDTQDRVPLPRFGKDHWTTFAYTETRTVDHHGQLGHDQMRCNPRLHPMLHAAKPRGSQMRSVFDSGPGKEYPTRLKTEFPDQNGAWGTEELHDHDDYTCLDDLVAAGLLTVEMPHAKGNRYVTADGRPVTGRMLNSHGDVPRPSFTTGMDEARLMAVARWSLTPLGRAVAGQYRAWRAEGRNSHQFQPRMDAARTTAASLYAH